MKNTINVDIFENFMRKHNLSKHEFCKLCKISNRTFENIISNNYRYNLFSLFKIAKVIDIQVYQMFN